METCARGFSFMPEPKVEVIGLQYIESEELERTWKTTLRQRQQQREQMVWDEFIKEQDVVRTLCQDDPYQFLEQLPEECLKEMMEVDLGKLKIRQVEEIDNDEPVPSVDLSDHQGEAAQHVVTFADEEVTDEEETYFHIFESEKDNDGSGPDDEVLNESQCSPCTVRENSLSPVLQKNDIFDQTKSSENVTNLMESNIHCAKVRELRLRINEEMSSILSWLESREMPTQESDEMLRMSKRSAEFCTRFNRIYMYQLQRQLNDIKRNSGQALPFAKHTQFQSQMVRIVSLHQHMLQSYQVFRKSLTQTNLVRDSADTLCGLVRATRDMSTCCCAVPAPSNFKPIQQLYEDIMMANCEKLQQAVNDHSEKLTDFLKHSDSNRMMSPKKKDIARKKCFGSWSKSGTKSGVGPEARLSMYSLDTLRLNLNAKSSSSKDNQSSGTSKTRGTNNSTRVGKRAGRTDAQLKTPKKSPRNRRPLMRDPQNGKPRVPRAARDTDIPTMVEAVDTCASSYISRDGSLAGTPRTLRVTTPRTRNRTLQDQHRPNKALLGSALCTQRKPVIKTPRSKARASSPKVRNHQNCTKENTGSMIDIGNIKSDPQEMTEDNNVLITPVSKIQSTKNNIERVSHCGKYNENVKSGNSGCNLEDGKFGDGKAVSNATKLNGNIKEESAQVIDIAKDAVGPAMVTAKGTHIGESSRRQTPRGQKNPQGDAIKVVAKTNSTGCEVSRLVKQLCSGDTKGGKNERVTGVRNAQLLCINAASPRQPTTPQLLRILEETIQKKSLTPLYEKQKTIKDAERYRMTFNIKEKTTENLYSYRTKFVQYMLTSPMYANCLLGKPWEMIGRISDKIIDDLLLAVGRDLEIHDIVRDLYDCETQ